MLMEGVGGKTKPKTCLGFCEHLTHDCYSSYLLQPTLLYSLAQCTKLYIPSTPNNSNQTHTFMCLGRTGRFGQR